MKAIEFSTIIEDEKHIDIPSNLQANVHKNQSVRVLILVSEDEGEKQSWSALSRKQFLSGYSDADSIYDNE
jgi:hypothetical protein